MPHTIALAQCGSLPDTTKNLKTAEYFIHQAANAGAALIVFPEYFMYPCIGDPTLYVNHSQSIEGPFVSCMSGLAEKFGIWILFGMNEAAPKLCQDKCFNTLILLDDSGILQGTYRKTHLFDAFDWHESDHTAAGDVLFPRWKHPLASWG
ncbi:MAG: nitrilase-related carbon-nitrogen hydrolase [Blautia marasmi]